MTEHETETRTHFGIDTQASDGELILRIAKGNTDAFEEIYQRFARPILAFVHRRSADPVSAQSAIQSTFISIWRSASNFRPEHGTASKWIFGVTQASLSNSTEQKIREESEEPPEVKTDTSATKHDQLTWEIHTAFERIPTQEQEVLSLMYFAKLPQEKIANQLNLPLETVNMHARSGLSRMATLLEGVESIGRP